MAKKILKELPGLIQAGVITEETAHRIRDYYLSRTISSPNRVLIVFALLGAILVGLGIILIIAHNWDELSRPTKTFLAFLPLLTGQVLCGYTLLKQALSVSWREGTATFLFLAVGATISFISQIYNIPGSISSFLLSWMLLVLPLVYIMRSSAASLMYLAGISYYACETGYWSSDYAEPYLYWLLLLLVFPHYYRLHQQQPAGNFTIFHHWFIPLSVIITLGTLARSNEKWMLVAYMSLFGVFYLIGTSKAIKARNNGYRVLGALGALLLLLVLSFHEIWEELSRQNTVLSEEVLSAEFLLAMAISLAGVALLYWQNKGRPPGKLHPLEFAFLLFIPTFVIGLQSPLTAVIIINLVLFATAVFIIVLGANKGHLGILNFGLLILTALLISRFFDTDISFVVRGLIFVLIGLGFFYSNYRILNKRKTDGI